MQRSQSLRDGQSARAVIRPLARPKSSGERWACLVEDAKRIVASRDEHTRAELRWAIDTLAVHERGHSWHDGQLAAITVTPEPAPVVKPPIVMKPPITQAQLSEAVARFASVVAMLRDFYDRSDPDTGGSVEPGRLLLDVPVLDADIDIFEETFRDMFISRGV